MVIRCGQRRVVRREAGAISEIAPSPPQIFHQPNGMGQKSFYLPVQSPLLPIQCFPAAPWTCRGCGRANQSGAILGRSGSILHVVGMGVKRIGAQPAGLRAEATWSV